MQKNRNTESRVETAVPDVPGRPLLMRFNLDTPSEKACGALPYFVCREIYAARPDGTGQPHPHSLYFHAAAGDSWAGCT